jgi:endonuclease/exonuclease/phosphatase family metal-dependent hydrolase
MPRVTVGTFNIRLFPDRDTVVRTVATRLGQLQADAVMVQEIRDAAAFDAALALASADTGRRYAVQLGPMCASSELMLGVVYDEDRLTPFEHRTQVQLDPQERCSCRDGHPPAALSVLDHVEGGRLTAMSVHLQFGARRWQYRSRRDQWDHLMASIVRVEQEFGGTLAVAGDFNSTGYADDDRGERTFIQRTVADAGLSLATRDIGCTAYWQPNRRTRDYLPSMLDHILLRDPPAAPAEVLGMCAAPGGGRKIECEAGNPDFHEVSDHCPVRVELDLTSRPRTSAT